MLLKDRIALVYGASGAVGATVARAFAREGAVVVLAARRIAPLEAVAAEIRTAGGRAEIAPVDALDPVALEDHLKRVVAQHGPVRIMFNAVSWDDVQGEPLTRMAVESVMAPITLGLRTWLFTGPLLARHMAAHGGGVILGITANAGREPVANVGGFGIACAAVEHLLRQLAVENGPHGVRVCWVRSPGSPDAPGVREVWTEIARARGISFEALHTEFAKDTPLRTITALAQVADAAVLLASDLAAGMTGTLANATGGSQID
jgi:NAD(P)-dependent dehydrogenase (short-subunit alcohol dehydrogenase family)